MPLWSCCKKQLLLLCLSAVGKPKTPAKIAWESKGFFFCRKSCELVGSNQQHLFLLHGAAHSEALPIVSSQAAGRPELSSRTSRMFALGTRTDEPRNPATKCEQVWPIVLHGFDVTVLCCLQAINVKKQWFHRMLQYSDLVQRKRSLLSNRDLHTAQTESDWKAAVGPQSSLRQVGGLLEALPSSEISSASSFRPDAGRTCMKLVRSLP